MIAIQVIQDRFVSNQQSGSSDEKANRALKTVRRPVRGTVLKEETFATMRVMTASGKNILLTDAGGSEGSQKKRQSQVYSNFLLQTVSEERMEKQQILETFGEPYIFFFGERPRMISFSGVLLNTFDFNWEAEWWDNYENFLRGTRCVENDARVFLAYDETLVSGYIIAASASKNAQERNHVNFQFTMFLTGYTNFSDIGDGTAIPLEARAQALRQEVAQSGQSYQVNAPKEFTPSLPITGQLSAGAVVEPSLVDGLKQGLSTVIQTWNSAQSMVNSAVTQMSNLARGDVLRVPFGFTGSFAYDAVDLRRVPQSTASYGPLTYTEFKDNKDEYVGASSHYGSSFLPVLLGETNDTMLRDQALVAQADTFWAEFGFEIPPAYMGGVSTIILDEQVGLFAAGATTAWQVSQSVEQGLSVLPRDPEHAARAISPVPIPE